ncbi:MAG: preprotein translocase subunit SecE [Planctomycetota bacterium]
MASKDEGRPSGPSSKEHGGTAGEPAGGPAKGAVGSWFQVHKPGEGYATRLGMMVVLMAYAGYACHHWYYNWVWLRGFVESLIGNTFLRVLTNWMYETTAARLIASGGMALLATASFLASYYYIYIKRASAEFLIKTDGELAKVTWPRATPWFRADTQVWGATYVVLLVIAALTLYVFGIDMVLQWLANEVFYGHAR